MDEDIIDLNALDPKPRVIKIGEQKLTLNPPKVRELLRLGYISQRMQSAPGLDDEQLQRLMDEAKTEIDNVIPEMKEIALTMGQTLNLMAIIIDMGTPQVSKDMEAKGITPDPKEQPQPES